MSVSALLLLVALGSLVGRADVSGSPLGTAEGNQVDAFFGYSAATAGDVHGDGYDDDYSLTPP